MGIIKNNDNVNGKQNHTAILESSQANSAQTKNLFTIQLSNFYPWAFMSEKWEP